MNHTIVEIENKKQKTSKYKRHQYDANFVLYIQNLSHGLAVKALNFQSWVGGSISVSDSLMSSSNKIKYNFKI